MRIAIVSGKGGTGKTLIATGLAQLIAEESGVSVYADADVEEPNGHLLLHPTVTDARPVHRLLPEIDAAVCTLCGECSRFCRFSALLQAKDRVLLFEDLCHSCGGCALVCPVQAIGERPHHVGTIESGWAGRVVFLQGTLLVGEPSGGPILRALAVRLPAYGQTVILDGPPGTSCAVVETLRQADVAVAVTEPTPFGEHDLRMTLQVLRTLGIPHGVVINRADLGEADIAAVCSHAGSDIPILGRIPFSRAIAESYARGQHPARHDPLLRERLTEIWEGIQTLAPSDIPATPGPSPDTASTGRPARRVRRHP